MGRTTDFGDKTIKKGFGPDKDKKLHVKEGQRLLVRVVTKLTEYMSHAVHDVLPPKRDAKTGANIPSIFNMNCARVFDEKADDYVGECEGHNRDYDVTERYVAGAMVLGMIQGKTVIPFAPSDCGRFWDFTAGRVAELRGAIENKFPELEADKVGDKLRQTTLVLGLKDEGGAEMYQKLTINVWEGTALPITEEHKAAFREEIPAILKEVSAPATLEEQARRLKKKTNPGGAPAAAKGQAPEQTEDNLDDLDLDGGGAAPAPAPAPKRATRAPAPAAAAAKPAAKASAAAVATAEDDLGDLGEPAAEEVLEEAPAPAPPPKKAAAAPAKKAAVAAATTTKKASDEVVDDMLDGLENTA